MSPDKWERIKDIFDELSESDPLQRNRVLSTLDDPEIRQEVERLLESYSAAGAHGGPVGFLPVSPAQLVQEVFRPRAFDIGSLLLDRFEIRTFLGAGGMGEVYEAFDRSLGELVAVKTIRPGLLSDPAVVQRFRWEVQRARRVSHPNVCRVHELFVFAPDDARELPFMTMELLPGPTLFDRVSDAPLSQAERSALALQICRGLQAAHDAGLIHRDLKSANVLLTGGDPGAPRAVITDFGLARLVAAPETAAGPLHSHHIAGTMQYLAPELIDGIGATRRSDIYALGVILFRMAARQYPFSNNDDPRAARAERLRPPDPRTINPDLDDRWAEVINSCLCAVSAERPVSADQVAARLHGENPWGSGGGFSRRTLLIGAASAATAAAVPVLWSNRRSGPPPLLEIRPFTSKVGSAPLGKAVANLFQLTLTSSKRVRLAALSNPRPNPAWLLTGEIASEGNGFVVRAALTEASSGRLLESAESSSANIRGLAGAVQHASMALDLLPSGASEYPRVGNLPLEDLDSLNPEALEDMTAALNEYSAGNLELAGALLDRAVARDSEFALAYVYRAIILSSTRRDHLALKPATEAYNRRSRLSARVRPHTEAAYHFMCGDYSSALAKYSEVARLYPTEAPLQRHLSQMYTIHSRPAEALHHAKQAYDLDPQIPVSVMMLVSAQEDAGDSAAAARTLQEARRTIPNSIFLPIAAGYTALLGHRWDEALDAYEKVALKADLEGLARSYQARTLLLAGRLDEAANSLPLRLNIIRHEDDRPNEDLYRYWLGQLALVNGFRDAARTQAAVLAAREPVPSSLFPLRAAAELGHGAGDPSLCAEAVAKAQRIHRDYPSRRSAGILHHCLGLQAAAQGRLPQAATLLAQAEEFWKDIATLWSAAELSRARGQWHDALPRYREIVARRPAAIRFECVQHWILANGRIGEGCDATGEPRDAMHWYSRFLFHWGSQKQLDFVRQCAAARARLSTETTTTVKIGEKNT